MTAASLRIKNKNTDVILHKIEQWHPKITNPLPSNIEELSKQFYDENFGKYCGDLWGGALQSFIRHQFTDYEDFLDQLEYDYLELDVFREFDTEDDFDQFKYNNYRTIKDKVNNAIIEVEW